MFIQQNKALKKRYMVLTRKALVVYADSVSFVNAPNKPWMVVPLEVLANVEIQKVDDKKQEFELESGEMQKIMVSQI